MFEKWFHAFADDGAGATQMTTETSSGDNGTPNKDLGYLMNKVITDDNKLRIVVSA